MEAEHSDSWGSEESVWLAPTPEFELRRLFSPALQRDSVRWNEVVVGVDLKDADVQFVASIAVLLRNNELLIVVLLPSGIVPWPLKILHRRISLFNPGELDLILFSSVILPFPPNPCHRAVGAIDKASADVRRLHGSRFLEDFSLLSQYRKTSCHHEREKHKNPCETKKQFFESQLNTSYFGF